MKPATHSHRICLLGAAVGAALVAGCGQAPPRDRAPIGAPAADVAVALPATGAGAARAQIDLAGAWEFRRDPDDVGRKEGWQRADVPFERTLTVPGAWNAQGVRYDSEAQLKAYEQQFINGRKLLGPERESEKLHNVFPGPAWYRRRVSVPAAWAGRKIWLAFGGVHRYAEVWVNGQRAGSHDAYVTAFRLDITDKVKPGRDAVVVVRVDARRQPERDPLMGCLDTLDFLFVTWGGIHRTVTLEASAPAWIDDLFAAPRIADESVELRVATAGARVDDLALDAEIVAPDGTVAGRARWSAAAGGHESAAVVRLPRPKLWSPRDPQLYTAQVTLRSGGRAIDVQSRRFGMRALVVRDGKFILNGQPVFLRGYGDDSIFPNTIAPPADREEYRRRLSLAKSYGFNYVRHHSWFPPEEYFEVADELGMMLQPEFPIAYAWNLPTTPEGRQVHLREWEAVIKQHRNHPSIVTWGMGNELYKSFEHAPAMYRIAKQLDPTRLVIDSDGVGRDGAGRATIDFAVVQFGEASSCGYRDRKYELPQGVTKPVVAHEVGYFATLPRLDQVELFREGMRPYWLHETRQRAEAQGVLDLYPRWLEASHRLHAISLKTNLEAARRSGLGGVSLWLFQDYPYVAEGIVDMFFKPKGLSAEQFRAFNAPTVLLLDADRRSFRDGETAALTLLASRFEEAPAAGATLTWELRAGGERIAGGKRDGLAVRTGGVQELAALRVELPRRNRAERLVLVAELRDEQTHSEARNEWNLWVFPQEPLAPTPPASRPRVAIAGADVARRIYPWAGEAPVAGGLLIAGRLEPRTLEWLERGGRVLLLAPEAAFPAVSTRFRAGSWDPSHRADHVGTTIDEHPALRALPHEGWCDLQFFELLQGGKAVLLDELPTKIAPIVRSIDLPQRLGHRGYLFEATVGRGKLLASGFNFAQAVPAGDPGATFLLDQLVRYALSPAFAPAATLPVDYLRARAASSVATR